VGGGSGRAEPAAPAEGVLPDGRPPTGGSPAGGSPAARGQAGYEPPVPRAADWATAAVGQPAEATPPTAAASPTPAAEAVPAAEAAPLAGESPAGQEPPATTERELPAGERGRGAARGSRRNPLIRLNRRVPGAQLPETGRRAADLDPPPELDPDAARALVEEFEAGVARAMESAEDGRTSPGDPERTGSTGGSER
jgi:hypothetical protein